MDPPQRRNGTIQKPDASGTEDLNGMPHYEYLEVFPEDDETHLYECTLAGPVTPTESQPNPPGHLWGHRGGGPGNTDHQSTNRPPSVRAPPPPPRPRPLSACLPGRQGPPPVPPRIRASLSSSKKQFSCDLTEPARKLNRSRTEIDNHVRISSSFSLNKDKKLLLWLKKNDPN